MDIWLIIIKEQRKESLSLLLFFVGLLTNFSKSEFDKA